MAIIVFSGGHSLKVEGSKKHWQKQLSNTIGIIYAGWANVRSGNLEVLINPHQIAYLVDDGDIPQPDNSPNPF